VFIAKTINSSLEGEEIMLIRLVDFLGRTAIESCDRVGRLGLFLIDSLRTLFQTKPKYKKIFYQMNYIGVDSLIIIFLTGAAVGAVLAVQSYIGLERYGATRFIGPVVFLSMSREFGPVLSAIMVAGRAGSAMTAEIGTMRITEQIDALKTLCINPKQYLVVPRIVGSTIIMPFLSLFCTLCGIISGYVVAVGLLGVNAETYVEAIREYVVMFDITRGLIKAVVFGFILSLIATYKGYTTRGGSKDVGIATTQSVVYASVTIIITDYILTSIMRHL
jgi:phospholipid/cholesterol/gamma-HCH transport system permease protein